MDGQGLQRRKDSEVHLRENCASCLMSGGVRCHTLARSLHVPPRILRLGASCILRLRRLLPPTFTPIVKRGSLQLLVPGLILVSPCLQFTSRDLLKTSSLTLTVASEASLDHEDQEALLGAKSPATVPRMKEGFSQAPPILR